MSSGIRPASWSNYSRSSGSFEPLYPYYHYQGAVSGGPGSGKREAGEDRSSLIEPGGYRVQLLGEQVRKDSARGLDIRAAKFVSRLSEFQIKQQLLQWESTRCGLKRGT